MEKGKIIRIIKNNNQIKVESSKGIKLKQFKS